jgi:hypothetical protein
MRSLAAALAVIVTISCSDNAGAPRPETALAPAPGDPAIADEADSRLLNAIRAGNAEASAAAIDTDFEWTNAAGETRMRADTLGSLPAFAAEFRDETDRETFHYGHLHIVTSARKDGRMMRVWAKRQDGWRLFAAISTNTATGATPFAAAGAPANADCQNPCRSIPFEPVTPTTQEIARIFQMLKMDEWHPNPDNWAPYVLDDVYYVTATARLSKADRVEHLKTLKESGAPSVPGDPVVSARIHDFGDSAVMIARHNPFRGGKPYYSLRIWAFADGRWQLANTQQTVISAAEPVPALGR